MRRIAVLDAPSNLGLRPPTATSVPGCAKAPGALRDHGLLTKLGARDAGCLTPPRYDPGDWRPGDGVAHAAQIAAYSRKLADRIGAILDAGEFPVILGGDCSILLGSGLAMHRLGEAVGGRIGLVFVDGHSDFRHPGNASYVGAAAGEDLALVTGRGQADLASIEGRRPYFRDIDVVVLGLRAQDEYRLDLQAAGIVTRPVPALRAEGAARSAQWARDQLVDCAGYWLHVDVDVLDPAVMPAVDAPTPGGIAFPELEILLAGLVESPHCLGVEITVFDPDYDPDGVYAAEIATTVAAGLAAARTVALRPDLIAARADLAKPASVPAPQPDPIEEAAASYAAEAGSDVAAASPAADAYAGSDVAAASPDADAAAPDAAADADAEAEAGSEAADDRSSMPTAVDDAAAGLASLWRAPAETGAADRASLLRPPADVAASVRASLLRPRSKADRGGRASLLRRPLDGGLDGAASLLRPAADAADVDRAQDAEDATLSASVEEAPAAGEETVEGEAASGDKSEISVLLDEAEVSPDAEADRPAESGPDVRAVEDSFIVRPLGQAPLLDSKPLPATRPGMLRPRPVDDHAADDLSAADGFSLPAQRPAFDLGSGSPADIV